MRPQFFRHFGLRPICTPHISGEFRKNPKKKSFFFVAHQADAKPAIAPEYRSEAAKQTKCAAYARKMARRAIENIAAPGAAHRRMPKAAQSRAYARKMARRAIENIARQACRICASKQAGRKKKENRGVCSQRSENIAAPRAYCPQGNSSVSLPEPKEEGGNNEKRRRRRADPRKQTFSGFFPL